jgi:glycosyltransferase involved in cell wall biosynthesis
MTENSKEKFGPLVSVIIPTFNRPKYLTEAIDSAVSQDYSNLQIIVVNDGGQDVSSVVNSFNDPRIVFINRKENRGLPYTLNEALAKVDGKYVCYLGDDDLYYPHHVSTLVDVLENKTDCLVAYSDLYKAYCKVLPDGSRLVLSKVVEVSRDFDRLFMLYFNHALHVSIMHRTDLLEKTGLYNENLNVLIDWDITRRLAFFTDFQHVYEITGEFYSPVGDCDRISVQRRKNKQEYARNVLTIRTTRPPKPWPKVKDLSVIFITDSFDRRAGETMGLIWRHTFYPYQVYLPIPQSDIAVISTDMPNIIYVPVSRFSSPEQRIDAALARCEGDYVVVVPNGMPINEMWIEDPLYALLNSAVERQAVEIEASTDLLWSAVVKKDDLLLARRSFPHLPLRQSLQAAGITIRKLRPEEIPFQFDSLLKEARLAEKNGSWAEAAEIFAFTGERYQNRLWMKALTAKALFKAGAHTKAAELSRQVNQQRPTIDTLLLEAKVCREKKDFNSAIELLKKTEQMLKGREQVWT